MTNMSNERIFGPNMKKLLARVVARAAIPPGGGFADGVRLITTPGALVKLTNTSIDWIDDAILAIRSAPDNPYGDDEEIIAAAILSNLPGQQ